MVKRKVSDRGSLPSGAIPSVLLKQPFLLKGLGSAEILSSFVRLFFSKNIERVCVNWWAADLCEYAVYDADSFVAFVFYSVS